jgi:DNA-binding beta-propeller fold protein YncE
VASSGTRRVVVLDMGGVGGGGGAPVPAGAFGGAGPDDPAPRCVAACAGLVAVSGWTKDDAGDHTVTLYAAGTWARVRVVGVGRGTGAGDGQLDRPYGLRFSADGARLLVADYRNHRVCCFRVSDGGFAGVVASEGAHGLSWPYDVVEVVGGVLVADLGHHRVVRVPADGSPATVLGGVRGSEPGQFIYPAALFVSADGAQVIVRELNGDRFQVFGVGV